MKAALPGRNETGIPRRQNALDPGFHDVRAGPEQAIVMLPVVMRSGMPRYR
jgi:hypothetical protein